MDRFFSITKLDVPHPTASSICLWRLMDSSICRGNGRTAKVPAIPFLCLSKQVLPRSDCSRADLGRTGFPTYALEGALTVMERWSFHVSSWLSL